MLRIHQEEHSNMPTHNCTALQGSDRGPDRGLDRGLDRGMDRGLNQGLDHVFDLFQTNEKC